MWFILSLVAVFFWSGSDFFSKLGSPQKDKNSHLKMIVAVGLVMGSHATYQVLVNGVTFNLQTVLVYLPVSFLYIFSMLLGYIGLRYIELSITSPICNTSGAVAAFLSFLFLKQTLSFPQLIATVLVIVAIVLLSYFQKQKEEAELKESGEEPGMKHMNSFLAFSIAYCIIDGLGTFMDAVVLSPISDNPAERTLMDSIFVHRLSEDSANVAYEYTFLVVGIITLLYLIFVKKTKFFPSYDGAKLLGAMSETAGQAAYIIALAANAVASAPLISSYCIFSALWAHIFLKERLSKKQYFAVALAVIGIVIMGFFGGD